MDTIKYYQEHGIMSYLRETKDMVKNIDSSIKNIVELTQNILIHQHWAERYGLKLTEEKINETKVRDVNSKLMILKSRGYNCISTKVLLNDKIVSICRDFSVVAASICREYNIPARARAGFADYFEKGKYSDHWVLEYYNKNQQRWVLVDAQLDEFQKSELGIDFNSLDVPRNRFITADKAWTDCRNNLYNPNLFGIFEWWGYSYLSCNLILDANSLIKIPMQPWDFWPGYKSKRIEEWTDNDYLIMDDLAEKCLNVDNDISYFKNYLDENDQIKVPDDFLGDFS